MYCKLTELNRRLSSHRLARFVGLGVFLVALGTYPGYFAVRFGLDVPPSSTGDEPSYDSLGWQLSRGRGFTVDYSDPAFRAPYDRAARENPALFTLSDARSGPITIRAPLFPLLIAATDRLWGRQFWAIRVINTAAMAATCALAAQFLFRRAGILPALIGAATFVAVDYRTRLYGRTILTEPLAGLLVALLALALIELRESRRLRWTLLAGGIAGLAVLTRHILALWMPGVALMVFLGTRRSPTSEGSRGPAVHTLVFVATALLVASPWMVRNSIVLESFKPLGTQGLMELSAGYGDESFARGGVWHNLGDHGFFDAVVTPGMSTVEAELLMAEHSSRTALRWIVENPGKALLLAPLKVINEFRPRARSEALIACATAVGLVLTIKSPAGRVLGGLLLTNAFAVAVTWSVGGRFLIPLLFVFHVLAALGVWFVLLAAARALKHFKGAT